MFAILAALLHPCRDTAAKRAGWSTAARLTVVN
jgi:hypothetical protein